MAMAADSSPNSSATSSPWAQLVRGGELETASPVTTTVGPNPPLVSPPSIGTVVVPERTADEKSVSEAHRDGSDGTNGNAARLKKPAWNKPLNGVVEASSIMGNVSWPALSESTRPGPKTSSDSSRHNSDGSTPSSQGPIISQTPQPQVNTNANFNSSTNHGTPRQRPTRHRGGGGSNPGGNGGSTAPSGGPAPISYSRPPPPPPPLPPTFSAIELHPYGNFGNFIAPILDTPVRGARPVDGVGSQSAGDQSQRSSSRRNGLGPRPRGDGQRYYNNGGRQDNDRRDVHLPHPFIPPPYIPPPPPGSASFIAPPNMRPFVAPVNFDMTSPYMLIPTLTPEPFRAMPLIAQAPAAPVFYPIVDHLHFPSMIIRQIDYYFSDANLVGDEYLRSNMDEEGWVPINLIANFPRVQQLTTDIQLIVDALRASVVVEVKGDKIRKRCEWQNWVPTGSRTSVDSATQPPHVAYDENLANPMEKLSLNAESSGTSGSKDAVDSQVEMVPDISFPEESISQPIIDKEKLTDEEVHTSQT